VDCTVQPSTKYYTKDAENSQLTTWMDILHKNYDSPDAFIPRAHINFVRYFPPERDPLTNHLVRFPNDHNDLWGETYLYFERDPYKLLSKYSTINGIQLIFVKKISSSDYFFSMLMNYFIFHSPSDLRTTDTNNLLWNEVYTTSLQSK